MTKLAYFIILFVLFLFVQQSYAQTFDCTGPLPTDPLQRNLKLFNCPKSFPNYTLLSAHRGYWKDYPEGSMAAFQAAADFGVEMMEVDVKLTTDDTLYVFHDWTLERLTNGKGVVRDANWNFYKSWNDLKNLRLRNTEGVLTSSPIPTLRQVLQLCKTKGILVSIDKADRFFDKVYTLVHQLGMDQMVTFKTTYQTFGTPQGLKNAFPSVPGDQLLKMYTPTIFGERYDASTGLQDTIKLFVDAGCPGFEMIYFKSTDAMLTRAVTIDGKSYTNILAYLRDKNRLVIQFPEWPETCEGNWSPGAAVWRVLKLDGSDNRGNWQWLMDTGSPNVVISDRLEVLKKFLEVYGKRNTNN
ncbi:glycerophosphodiester phosphodiesterase family protein [Pedobacter kyungheensis]|uniref:glycerophosphodiester phosphodiesterase family protein n=1 Tax=Pedobacter kyungheensis TaxID=1069985 RepID=UPI00068AC0D6|nr:glycerophosphodiester phosphodiesterase family protein [Pedobacter kyungheensis]